MLGTTVRLDFGYGTLAAKVKKLLFMHCTLFYYSSPLLFFNLNTVTYNHSENRPAYRVAMYECVTQFSSAAVQRAHCEKKLAYNSHTAYF